MKGTKTIYKWRQSRSSLKIKDHEEADKEQYAKVRTIIHEMILKAIPKEVATEAT